MIDTVATLWYFIYNKIFFMNQNIALSIFTAFAFGIWPLLVARTGVSKESLLTIITATLFLTTAIHSYLSVGSLLPDTMSISVSSFFLVCIAGLINGLGNITYSKVITVENSAKYQIVVMICIPVFIAIGNWLLIGTILSNK